ncbi:MAG: DUF3596 domain-containing protein [Candidatus Reddybacter sp.]
MAKGWEVHGGSLRVYFSYKGDLCREPLGLEPTEDNKQYAQGLAATIRHEIKQGVFDYAQRFPNSEKLKHNTVGAWLDIWLPIKERQVAPSTIIGYRRWVERHIRPKWGEVQADRIDALHIEAWTTEELAVLSNKSIKEVLSIFNQVFVLYRQRNRSAFNPLEGVRVTLPDDEDPDPFTLDEIKTFLTTPTHRPGDLNYAAFAMWCGPRPSEALALGWDDVDLKNSLLLIRRAVVLLVYKATKTKRSKRAVDLVKPALEALQRQFELTGHLPPIEIDVLQRDNRTIRKERFRPVFINQATGRPYLDIKQYRKSFWERHIEKTGVRYRGPSNCRHTFASQMLTANADKQWILDQLGHTTDAMLRRKYSKYIREDDRESRVERANRALGFD